MNPLKSLARSTYRGVNNLGSSIKNEFSPLGPLVSDMASTLKPSAPVQRMGQIAASAVPNTVQPITQLRNGMSNGTGALGGFARHYQDIQSYKKGGVVKKTGLALVHKGETVIPKDMKATDYLKYGRHVKSQGKPATYREHIKAKGDPDVYAKALNNKKEYTGKKGEYSKSKQGNFMKVHPLDR